MIRFEIHQTLAAVFLQPHPQPTSVSGPSTSGNFYPPSATLPVGGTPTSSMLTVGMLSCSETGHLGTCMRARRCNSHTKGVYMVGVLEYMCAGMCVCTGVHACVCAWVSTCTWVSGHTGVPGGDGYRCSYVVICTDMWM